MPFPACFLRPPEVTKIVVRKVLQNFEKTPNCTCWSKELNQKGFPGNIQYRTRPKGPPFDFFRHCATFFTFFPPKGPPSIFWSFATEWMLKNPKGSSLTVFFGIVRLFNFFHKRFQIHQHFDILKSFCYFLALDMAPTWAGFGLFFFQDRLECDEIFVLFVQLSEYLGKDSKL